MQAPPDMTTETFTFSLVFAIPDTVSLESHLDAFAAADCDDAAFMGPATDGTFTADFDREAPSFPKAVVSAIDDLRGAVEGLRVLRVVPDDLVTISAIAARTGRSDESIRLLQRGDRGPGGFPPVAGRINAKTQIWRWADVATWFTNALGEPPRGAEHARLIAAINHALGLSAMVGSLQEHRDEWAVVTHLLPPELEAA